VIVTVARKPLTGTVTASVLKYGTGALNINATRIAANETILTHTQGREAANADLKVYGKYAGGFKTHQAPGQELGRWPANLILQHLEGCRCKGTKEVKGVTGGPSSGANAFGQDAGWNAHQNRPSGISRYNDEDGNETVADWICAGGCPVAALDEQSGTLKSGAMNSIAKGDQYNTYGKMYERRVTSPASEGGASRFFKQIVTLEDLIEYLYTMITPVHVEGESIVVMGLNDYDWTQHDDESLHGFIGRGTPTSEQCREIMRFLKPGAHVMLMSPEDQPTGHVGACQLEDDGFEIRDAIHVLQGPAPFAYVAKPSRAERGAGNNHPTVKPVGIMEFLLRDVPKDHPVLDPFLGSGTTLLACLNTKHDGIGIEREEEYLQIADRRVRDWDRQNVGWVTTEIVSEAAEEDVPESVGLGSLFGFDEAP